MLWSPASSSEDGNRPPGGQHSHDLIPPARRRGGTVGGQQQALPLARTCSERYWRDLAVDALLELATARQRLALVDEDLVELVAHQRFDFYRKLGGSVRTLGSFRAEVRHFLKTGEEL